MESSCQGASLVLGGPLPDGTLEDLGVFSFVEGAFMTSFSAPGAVGTYELTAEDQACLPSVATTFEVVDVLPTTTTTTSTTVAVATTGTSTPSATTATAAPPQVATLPATGLSDTSAAFAALPALTVGGSLIVSASAASRRDRH